MPAAGEIRVAFRQGAQHALLAAVWPDTIVSEEVITVAMRQRIMPGAELIEFVCGENDRFTSYLDQAEKAAPGTK